MTKNSQSAKKSERPSLVLVNGSDASSVEGMARIWNALTGKDFTPEDRIRCQEKIDASNRCSTGTSDNEKESSCKGTP